MAGERVNALVGKDVGAIGALLIQRLGGELPEKDLAAIRTALIQAGVAGVKIGINEAVAQLGEQGTNVTVEMGDEDWDEWRDLYGG
jgi:hypothetical protein